MSHESPTVAYIVAIFLREHRYDGLFNADAGCGCLLSDLAPCGEMLADCKAGYKMPCTCGEGCDFDVGTKEARDDALRREKDTGES